MIKEEWLCSSFNLCDLVTSGPESGPSDDAAQIVINGDSYPRPAYDPSSIQHTVETYSRLLDATLEKNIEPIQHFALMTAKTIIDSAVKFRDPSESVNVRQDDVEMLAEKLTLQVCCKALEEMERHHYTDDPSSKNIDDGIIEGSNENASVLCSSGYTCDKNTSEMETYNKMEEHEDVSALAYANSFKSMASFGSIEYPDAPPSTPLLPEMMRSRASFTRKLKGGLAKEFLPSPPPPTPKDHMQPLMENQIINASTEFMVKLMRSLSLECCGNGGPEEDEGAEPDNGHLQNDTSRLTDYATQLSADILNFITTNEIKGKDESCVKCTWAIADQLVSETVTMSLAEVMAREERKEQTTSYSAYKVDVTSDKQSSTPFSATDGVKALATELIINAVVHAFAKLRQSMVKQETKPNLLGQTAEPQPCEEESYSNTLGEDSVNSHKAKTFRCCNNKSELNTISADEIKVTSLVHRFARDFAEDVLQHSVYAASSLQFNHRQSERAEIASQKDIKAWVIKIHAEESRQVQELQCALLWVATSQRGASALQFDLLDTSLQQQLCRLSQSARLNGWTVGTLMASLHHFCDMQQEPRRGRHKSAYSLLEHLQNLIDNVCLN